MEEARRHDINRRLEYQSRKSRRKKEREYE